MLNIEFVNRVFIFRSTLQVQNKTVSVTLVTLLMDRKERGEQEKGIKHKILLHPWDSHQTLWEGTLSFLDH